MTTDAPRPSLTDTEREQLWELIAQIRNRYPRTPDDAPTDEIVDAVAG